VPDERAPEPRFVDEGLERSLDRWRDWQSGQSSNPLGYARSSTEPTVTGSTYRTSSDPADMWSHAEVERAIASLTRPHATALRLDYLRPDMSLDAKAAVLGLSRRSFARRVDEAKRTLVDSIRRARRARGA
jgi:predicted DNA-binding protein (UPF0251 family)